MARHRSLRIRRNHGLQFPRHDRGRHRVRRRRRHFQPSLRCPLRHPRPTRGVEVTVASATDSELGVDATPWTLLRGKASHLREILRPFIRVLRANPLTLIGFILVVTDVFLAFPSLVLALAIAASLGRGTGPSILAVLLTWWPYYVRLARGEVLAVKHRPYVVAARAAGVSEVRILFRHVLRNLIEPLLVYYTLDIGT